MSEQKHTPGPWAATVTATFDARYFCVVFARATPVAELAASARVAEAAPDLLAALAPVKAWYDGLNDGQREDIAYYAARGSRSTWGVSLTAAQVLAAMAALAKTGGPP